MTQLNYVVSGKKVYHKNYPYRPGITKSLKDYQNPEVKPVFIEVAKTEGYPRLLRIKAIQSLAHFNDEKVLIKVKVFQDDYNPLPNGKIDLTINSISKGKTLLTHTLQTDEIGEAEFKFLPRGEGYYSVKLEGTKKGLETEISFSVFNETAEYEKPLVNSLLLKTMTQATGGIYQVLSPHTDLSGHQFLNPEIRMKSDSRTLSLWNNWWAYFLIVGFLFIEWWVRRKSGLS